MNWFNKKPPREMTKQVTVTFQTQPDDDFSPILCALIMREGGEVVLSKSQLESLKNFRWAVVVDQETGSLVVRAGSEQTKNEWGQVKFGDDIEAAQFLNPQAAYQPTAQPIAPVQQVLHEPAVPLNPGGPVSPPVLRVVENVDSLYMAHAPVDIESRLRGGS